MKENQLKKVIPNLTTYVITFAQPPTPFWEELRSCSRFVFTKEQAIEFVRVRIALFDFFWKMNAKPLNILQRFSLHCSPKIERYWFQQEIKHNSKSLTMEGSRILTIPSCTIQVNNCQETGNINFYHGYQRLQYFFSQFNLSNQLSQHCYLFLWRS